MIAAASGAEGCLSDFALDRLMSGEMKGASEEARARAHLESCARCAARATAFASVEAPPVADVAAYVRQAEARRAARSPRRTVALFASAAALAAGLVVAVGLGTRESTRVKGSLAFTGWIRQPSGALTRLVPGAVVAAGDGLRFEVASASGGFVAVLGLDTTGRASAYVPASGPLPALGKGAPVVLPGSIVADDTKGAERLVALVCAQPRDVGELASLGTAALAKAGGDPRRVEPLGAGCEEASLLIEKRAP